MSEKIGYNGWTNYATWLVALHLDNYQCSQEHCYEMAREALAVTEEDMPEEERKETATAQLAEFLEAEHEDALEEILPAHGVFRDLCCNCLGSVNWHEIAKHYLEET